MLDRTIGMKLIDKYGRAWDLPANELCFVCGQPDNCGDCNHERYTDEVVKLLRGEPLDNQADRP